MIAKILTYAICGFFIFCAYNNARYFLRGKNPDRTLPYALGFLFLAFVVAMIGGI